MKRLFLGIILFLMVLNLLLFSKKAVVFYDEREINNPQDWFGIWYLKPTFSQLGIDYYQLPISKIDKFSKEASFYLLYKVKADFPEWKKVYNYFLDKRFQGKKIVLMTPSAFKINGLYDYNYYNKILNLAGVEDRNYWTDKIKERQLFFQKKYFKKDFAIKKIIEKNVKDFRELFSFRPALPILKFSLKDKVYLPLVITDYGAYLNPNFFTFKIGNQWKLILDFPEIFKEIISFSGNESRKNLGEEIPRKFLVIYSSKLEPNYRATVFHQYLQLPLNYLGYSFQYLDIDTEENLDKYLNYPLICYCGKLNASSENSRLLDFLVKSQAQKYIFLGYLPFFNQKGDWLGETALFLKKFSLKYDGDTSCAQIKRVLETSFKYYPFEEKLPFDSDFALSKISSQKKNIPVLKVELKNGKIYTPSFYNEKALFLMSETFFDWKKEKYFINLFEVLKDFLKPEIMPLYQQSLGKRIAFSHVDGDGFANSFYKTPEVIGGERIFSFVKKTNFPFTISFIGNEILPRMSGRFYLLDLARKIISLPWIKLASHSFTHPFMWSITDKEVKNAEGYSQGKFDYKKEIKGSLEEFSKLFGEKTNLFFWTGDCQPTEEELAFCWQNKIWQINGGDNIKDDGDSYYRVKPPYVLIGKEIQFYNQACNENIYTNLWRSNFGGFVKVIETFKNTYFPYKISPIDVYFHFYSGARLESFSALKKVFKWLLSQNNISPYWVEDYLRLVNDFINCRVYKEVFEKKIIYFLETNGQLRDIKVFPPIGYKIDYDNSKGIIGFKKVDNGYQIYLNKEKKHTIVFLKSKKDKVTKTCFLSASHYPTCTYGDNKEEVYLFKGWGPFSFKVSRGKIRKCYLYFPDKKRKRLKAKLEKGKRIFAFSGEIKGEIKIKLFK